MRKFCVVKKEFQKVPDVDTVRPTRSTTGSAGYDFYSKINARVKPGEIVKIWTDIKAEMEKDEVLLLYPRSSMGGKWMLTNTTGIIDSDYFENKHNDGNIGIFLKNISNEVQHIVAGYKIAQGIFTKYLITADDAVTATREGGFGSTGK